VVIARLIYTTVDIMGGYIGIFFSLITLLRMILGCTLNRENLDNDGNPLAFLFLGPVPTLQSKMYPSLVAIIEVSQHQVQDLSNHQEY
jgi:hypothetical protein